MIPWVVLIYGILTAALGLLAWFRKGSMPSLIGGGVSGIALIVAAVVMLKGSYNTGWWISLVVALVLLGRFGSSAISKGFEIWPGGLIIILSIIVIAALLLTRRAQ
ncbi:MAG TPA: TMEM14 family protein [Blastocatellia bacterium]|jgi:uncharacterized membrane protein (UPF0136 family)|nr:TMEM14 family protein [Blastocatellia bacterium]